MQQQFTQLVKFNNLADYQLTIQRMFQYEDVILDYKDLDITFIDQILKVYEDQNDQGLIEYAKLERYLIKNSSSESDKEHFFERQHMLLSKKLPYDFVSQLLGLLFQFKAKLNGQYSILFYFKSFEAFETVLRGIGNRSPLPSPKPNRVTIFSRQTSWKQPQSIRNSNFSKIFKSAFTKKSKSDDVSLLKNEILYKSQKINGKLFYNLNEIDQFNIQEQQLLLNLSKQDLQLVSNDSDSSEHEEDQNEQNMKIGYDIDKREKYLNSIFGGVPKYTSQIIKLRFLLSNIKIANSQYYGTRIASLYGKIKLFCKNKIIQMGSDKIEFYKDQKIENYIKD
ncbi:hypothetical protein pb186bvf_000776 [Paramecium bursaria]